MILSYSSGLWNDPGWIIGEPGALPSYLGGPIEGSGYRDGLFQKTNKRPGRLADEPGRLTGLAWHLSG